MKLKENVIVRELMGETVLIPLGTSADFNGMIIVNPTASEILKIMPDAETRDDIVKAMLEIYDADEETVKTDVDEFLGQLEENGLME